MRRKTITKAVGEAVFREYSHRCAICGMADPQMHHIDGDHGNNKLENLIPLCPNHHLIDQHNPTKKMDQEIVSVFRKFKDPLILYPQFKPLYDRFSAMYDADASADVLIGRGKDLSQFVQALQMGSYYVTKVYELVMFHPDVGEAEKMYGDYHGKRKQLYRRHLDDHRDRLLSIVVELLRYQTWEKPTEFGIRPTR